MDYQRMSEDLYSLFNQVKGSVVPPQVKWLSEGEMKALDYLASGHENSLSGSIARGMGLSSGRTSLILNSLERKGYIARHPDKRDQRQIHVSISRKGQGYLDNMREQAVGGFACFLEALGEEKAQTMYDLMKYLLTNKDDFMAKIMALKMKEGLPYAKADRNH